VGFERLTNVRAEARVDLAAIRHNVAVLAERAPRAAVMAVVKADGYGHGMLPAARAALAGGAQWLGVAAAAEALGLRRGGITAPVLAWLLTPGELSADLVAAGVDVAIYSVGGLREAAAAATASGRPARVHLKVDTGLSRGGSAAGDWRHLCEAAAKSEADGVVHVVAVWSHLACADEPGHPSIDRQLVRFAEAVALAEGAGLHPELLHMANSAATLSLPASHYDLVRPGIAVYGLSPIPARDYGLRPAMTLVAGVALTKRVPAGEGVSYGHRYVTDRETTLALLAVGYADGIARNATNVGPIWLAGKRRRIAGTVSMDQVVVDVGDDLVQPGDEAVLFGSGAGGEPTAQDWARILGTISYEIVSRIGPRVPRVYRG
jgi:alanine racemase